MTDVAILGPGRVGTLLAAGFSRAGHRVTAVAGGSPEAREALGRVVAGVRPLDRVADAAAVAELLVLAVPDDAIDGVVLQLARDGAVGEQHAVVHVAGSRGLGALRRVALTGARVAACHPAMTVPRGSTDPELLHGVAWAVTAAPSDRAWAHRLVADLGGDPHDLPDDRRALYHAGLAVAANAVGAAVATARQLLLAAKVDDPGAFLGPLIDASIANVLRDGAAALTGPVVRGDAGTVAAHLAVLERELPELHEAYRSLARGTLATARLAMDDDAVQRLEELLADPAPPPWAPGEGGEAPPAPPAPPPGGGLPLHPDT